MGPLILRPLNHVRLRPLSVNDRRAHQIPVVRVKPLVQLVQRPKPVPAARLPQHIQQKGPTLQSRNQPTIIKVTPVNKIDKYKNIGIGKILLIIGNGPSHRLAPLDQLKNLPNIHIMSVNKPDDRIWPTTYWTFCDNTQQIRHRGLWEQYTGPCFNTPSVKDEKSNTVRIKTIHQIGFSTDLSLGLQIGNSSVYAAMQIGRWMAYDYIYIYGCDMGPVNGKLYPWGSNPDVSDSVREKRFKAESNNYQWAANNLSDEERLRYTFCSEYNPWPFIKRFPNLACKESVQFIINKHSTQT